MMINCEQEENRRARERQIMEEGKIFIIFSFVEILERIIVKKNDGDERCTKRSKYVASSNVTKRSKYVASEEGGGV